MLLKNDGLLPLNKQLRAIAVIGPNADDQRNQLGDYTPNSILQEIVTVREGIRRKVSPQTKVLYAKGCDIMSEDKSGFGEAQAAAKAADLAIVVVGEAQNGSHSTDGEGYDVASLDLAGVQRELVQAVYQTGTPTVVVLINGRPLSTRWIAENIPAVVEAWSPGERGGDAVADVLFGDYNPSGRLPITIPRHVGQLPVYYNHAPSKTYWTQHGWGRRYVDMSSDPLYVFGHGLSYSEFAYSNLEIAPKVIGETGEVTVSFDVKNTSAREGADVAQLYLNDELASVSRPVKQLVGFEKVDLKAGETRKVSFTVTHGYLSLLDRNLKRVVEPGTFKLMVGRSSADIRLTGEFEVR